MYYCDKCNENVLPSETHDSGSGTALLHKICGSPVRIAKTDYLKDNIEADLKSLYPHGHPEFIPMTLDECRLHSEKNHDYARGGDPLGNFQRRAKIAQLYKIDLSNPAQVAIWDAFKQIDAALWMLSQGYEGEVEDVDKRLQDAHVYFKLARLLRRDNA